ncbi:MAG: biotin/lipoyl-binding protein [Firmicutes bacterium]|nr:biotin/lipoyl-binding protein [Bacillota bacterium]MDY6161068.1 biotin/lipoyl-binding protein [Candidatus Faecousia sp.]
MKKAAAWLLAGCMLLGLSACSVKENQVFVQKVADLAQMGGIAPTDRFSGLVVSESVTEIQRDKDKVVDTLYVREGDDVTQGQELFSYDTDQLQLTLEKQKLELEQLASSIENYGIQIAQLEKDRERAGSGDKLKYTLQIQTNQIDLKEAELKLKTKQSEVQKSEHLLANALVTSPVDGRVTSISEDETDEYGKPKAYITIQQSGSYRVKGTLNEMQRGSIMEGTRLRMESRLDPTQYWMGTVTLVDYENPTQGNNNGYYISSGSDEMSSSSRYPFYVELDSSDGLLLGQHLYLSVASEEEVSLEGVTLGSAFICFDEEGNSYVWAESSQGKLEKRTVELGEYDMAQDVYEILSGLAETDYVAFPDEELCVEGAPTSRQTQKGGSGQ